MKNKFILYLILTVGNMALINLSYAKPAYLVVDYYTKKIFFNVDGQKKKPIASLTKLATANVALDFMELANIEPDVKIVIPQSARELVPETTPIYGPDLVKVQFLPGDVISISDALSAAIIASDNVCAQALAHFFGNEILKVNNKRGEPVEEFVKQMNTLARKLNMQRTRFVNPHGLDMNFGKKGYSTAEDLARLAIYAMAKSSYRFYCSLKTRILHFYRDGHELSFKIHNTNRLIGNNGIDGIKTGTTQKAGPCLAVSSMRPTEVIKMSEGKTRLMPKRLIAIILNDSDRFNSALRIINDSWAKYDSWMASGRRVVNRKEILDMGQLKKK